jgi:hypothetical protein
VQPPPLVAPPPGSVPKPYATFLQSDAMPKPAAPCRSNDTIGRAAAATATKKILLIHLNITRANMSSHETKILPERGKIAMKTPEDHAHDLHT